MSETSYPRRRDRWLRHPHVEVEEGGEGGLGDAINCAIRASVVFPQSMVLEVKPLPDISHQLREISGDVSRAHRTEEAVPPAKVQVGVQTSFRDWVRSDAPGRGDAAIS